MSIVFVVLAATFYNAVLAVINAHVVDLGFNAVAASEMAVLALALMLIIGKGLYEQDLVPLAYLVATLVLAVYVSAINGHIVLDYFRNILIIFCFVTLGTWTNRKTIKYLFLLTSGLVFGVLCVEIFFTDFYADFFYPAMYFYNTRGVELFEVVDSKLFRNALGFEGRFSFGIINHRSSSLFLEQVSLANFCGVMMVYLMTLWGRFTRFQKWFCLFTIVLILVTNDTRTMLLFGGIALIGYFVFPYLPRILCFLYLPIFLFMGFMIYVIMPNAVGDNIPGRVVLTMEMFKDMDLLAQLGFAADLAPSLGDSGYIYVIVIGTIFSFLLLWLFVSCFPAYETAEQRRFAHALCIFIFMNMMIGGTAIFSIKIAALLWLLAGHMKFSERERGSLGFGARSFAAANKVQG
ncbi:MAG: hypothetical protein JJ866_06375 [Roseibium sp.]|uniref:hypothetical protein n=1 Tax=Roseibium sp. TaxID=1936156 RepID=UPI001B107A15|nr:hypothetical protein [Roseibium sp.]MBO6891548.1 hypothetical protein [Roseibium sp.]MBO6931814.1 hypothetical protein [Roseibium sp.]